MASIDTRSLRYLGGNVLLAVLYASFAYVHWTSFVATHRTSLILAVLVETTLILIALTRRVARAVRRDWETVAVAWCGSFLPLFLRPVDGANDLSAAQALQAVGLALQLAAALSLGRSFGLLPANRGVKTRGMYRWVRHPLYASYLPSLLGYLLNNPSLLNIGIVGVAMTAQVARIRDEEHLLLNEEAYAVYAGRVRYRLIPGVW